MKEIKRERVRVKETKREERKSGKPPQIAAGFSHIDETMTQARNRKRNKAAKNSSRRHALIRKIGLSIHGYLFKNDKPVEWLAFQSGVARSSIREIIAGRSNPRILTLDSIARAMGYPGVLELFRTIDR